MIVISDTNIIYSCFYKPDGAIANILKDKAEEIAQFVDPDDYPFIALHLEKRHKIWTCDFELTKGLKEMGYDICVTTKDLKAKCYKKSV